MLALHDWQNFYMLTGAAAATLIGLLFVAVSISVGMRFTGKEAKDAIRTFVTPILFSYSQVLFVSCLGVMPLQSPFILSIALAVLGIINLLLALKVCWRMLVLHREKLDLEHWIWHFLLPFLAGILFVGTAPGFFWGIQLTPVGLAVANLLCLAIGLRNSWVLTIWLILSQGDERDASQAHTG